MNRNSAIFGLTVLVAAAATASSARADDGDLLSSIYTDSGFEVLRDNRLFALFSALNVAGYDRGLSTRTEPFPRAEYHALRSAVRDALAPSAGKVRGPVDAFLDAHPAPLETYVRGALLLGEGPSFKALEGFPKELAGLDSLLASFSKASSLDKLQRSAAPHMRAELKRVAEAADAPFQALRAAFRLNEEEAPLLVLMPNPLDAPDSVFALRTPDDVHVVVLGVPAASRPLDLSTALKAYARLLARESVKGVKVSGLDAQVAELVSQGILPTGTGAEEVLAGSLEAAVAAQLWSKKGELDVAAAQTAGYVAAGEFFKALSEPSDAFDPEKGSFFAQVAARVDLKKRR